MKSTDIFPVSVALARGRRLVAHEAVVKGTKVCVRAGVDTANQTLWSCTHYKNFFDAATVFIDSVGPMAAHKALSTRGVEWL